MTHVRTSSHGFRESSRWREDVRRRRQISQVLHVIAPAAAMCIALSDGPEVMCPALVTVTTWTVWPWNALLCMAAAILLWDVRVFWLRRRGAPTLLRPTLPVNSPYQALRFSEDILDLTNVQRGGDSGLWEAAAAVPLAALAYTASQLGERMALPWLERTVGQLAAEAPTAVWEEAAETVAAATPELLHHGFVGAMRMNERQRESVAHVMRDAITEHAAVRR